MWWIWCIAGLVLLGLEMIQPAGFFLFFFGLGAFGTGLVLAALGDAEAWVPWALFSTLSIVSLVLFRAKARAFLGSFDQPRSPELAGEVGIVVEKSIPARGTGVIELRGTQWQARNGSDSELAVDARVRVKSVSGLTVEVVGE